MQVVFIVNGSKRHAKSVVHELAKHASVKFSFDFHFTTLIDNASALAIKYAAASDIIIAVGGDGTLNGCVQGIMEFQIAQPYAQCPSLGLLPYGTGNDFARNFGWTKSIQDFMTKLYRTQFRTINVGIITYKNNVQEFFINEASIGLGPDVVERVNSIPTYWNGNLKFGWAILLAFLTYKKQNAIVESDKFNWNGKALAVVFANGKYFGSGIGIAPEALMDDDLLDVTIIGDVSLFEYLKYLPKLKRCQKIIHPEVHYFKTKQVKIDTTGCIEKDGEMGAMANAMIALWDRKIKLLI